jgi:hypothetical protein
MFLGQLLLCLQLGRQTLALAPRHIAFALDGMTSDFQCAPQLLDLGLRLVTLLNRCLASDFVSTAHALSLGEGLVTLDLETGDPGRVDAGCPELRSVASWRKLNRAASLSGLYTRPYSVSIHLFPPATRFSLMPADGRKKRGISTDRPGKERRRCRRGM